MDSCAPSDKPKHAIKTKEHNKPMKDRNNGQTYKIRKSQEKRSTRQRQDKRQKTRHG